MALIVKAACCFLFFLAILQYSHVSAVAPAHPPKLSTSPAPTSSNILEIYCKAKCQERCKVVRPFGMKLCEEVCTKCCLRTKCVPTGPVGIKFGKCKNWTFTLYRGIPYKCP
ncbi:unnamed protein product [Linum tenue]|uniref:Uncharacterized protein n=1 Tax=Linum tenue TaxID=586396 RepID=A0AAV0NA48_9ROSI|nr:unnamed protein product [Linum tenue]